MNTGIYSIRNLINNYIYIGSSINLEKRKNHHFRRLLLNKHGNDHLQKSYNKHGKDNFVFEIISYIEDKSKLLEYEQKWLDFFKPEYNICKVAGSPLGIIRSDEYKEKQRIAKKGFIPWNKGIKTGQIPSNSWKGKKAWNSGLTKETDDRVKRYGLNVSKTKLKNNKK